ncbi:MAG TPA: ABC transporter permease subunit [Dongiaceae bacterium]|nr:ABC transporter permease subunit [Dongiaceae bacterium]
MSAQAATSRGIRLWRAVALPLVLLAAWEASSHSGLVDPHLLPPLEDVVARAWNEGRNGDLLTALSASLGRDLAGFVLGAAAGTAAGLLLGFSRFAENLLGPTLRVHRQIALFAWVPLIAVWFGAGEPGKIAFIALAAFQPGLINIWRGVQEIPQRYRELAAVLTFGRLDFLRFVAIPAMLPAIFTGLKAALIYAWQATIGAELFMTIAPGIGGVMMQGRQLFQMDLVLLTILLLGLVGAGFNTLAGLSETLLLRRRLS